MSESTASPALKRLPTFLGLGLALLAAFVMGALCTGGPATTSTENVAADTVWTCAMHPQIRQPEPGACPICGMDLVPVGDEESTGSESIVLSDRARTLAQLRTTPVVRQGDAAANLRLLGRVETDESTRRNVTTWVGGRIDRLQVSTTGEEVRAGQVIASLYSPEVYGAHQDLLTAKAQVAGLAGGTTVARQAADAALRAARERLRLLGVPQAELDRMEQAEGPTQSVAIRSPFSGTVLERLATEGAYVQTGTPLYRIADLSRLWVQLDAYESDLPRLALGQDVTLTVEAMPGQTFEGRVAFIDPTVDPQRRTARVRVEVSNPDGRLRPGMFAEASVWSGEASAADAPLVVPATAPLFTGRRSIVYVETRDETHIAYEPRTVRLGPRLGEFYPVVAGLSEGERVVSRGAFALDADLQIRGGPSMMSAPDDDVPGAFDSAVELPPAERAQLVPVVQHYLDLQRALAEDDHPAAVAAAERLEEAVRTTHLTGPAATPWSELAEDLSAHGRHVAMSKDLQGARGGFEPLSAALEGVLRVFGNPLDQELHVAFCPMAQSNRGARWVQQGVQIDNAYFGATMRTCGEIEAEVDAGSFLPASGTR